MLLSYIHFLKKIMLRFGLMAVGELTLYLENKHVSIKIWIQQYGIKINQNFVNCSWNFILGDGEREIDVHTFVFDDKGNNIYGTAYPEGSLTGTGEINGEPVKCIPPEWVVKFHAKAKYEPKAKDIQDVNAICDKFGIDVPENYKKS